MKYMIIRSYTDCYCMTERTDSITDAISACAIYAADPDIFTLYIVDTTTGVNILSWVNRS